MTDEDRNLFIDLAIKVALEALARSALQRLVVASGTGGLDEIENEIVRFLKNHRFPGAPVDFEPEMVDMGVVFVSTLIDEARGDGFVRILD